MEDGGELPGVMTVLLASTLLVKEWSDEKVDDTESRSCWVG